MLRESSSGYSSNCDEDMFGIQNASLKQYGIKESLYKWLANFLTQRQMRVVIDGQLSGDASVDSGVPRGTVLGPLLFLCHINSLPSAV